MTVINCSFLAKKEPLLKGMSLKSFPWDAYKNKRFTFSYLHQKDRQIGWALPPTGHLGSSNALFQSYQT